MKLNLVITGLLILFICSCQQFSKPVQNQLEGVWKITEIKKIGPKLNYTNPKPQPGLFIFSKNYYSMVWIPGDESRKASARRWYLTDAEKIKAFNTIVVNSGTYELTDSTLTTFPLITKTPEFMGGKAVYEYQVKADTLWLTMVDTYSYDNVQDSEFLQLRIPIRLLRVE